MRNRSTVVLSLLAAFTLAGFSGGFQSSDAVGTIAVTVVDSSDQPAEGVVVELAVSSMGTNSGSAGEDTAKSTLPPLLNPASSPLAFLQEAKVVAKQTTDKDGKCQFKMKAGRYRVSVSDARNNIVAYQTVRLEANKTSNAKLRVPKK